MRSNTKTPTAQVEFRGLIAWCKKDSLSMLVLALRPLLRYLMFGVILFPHECPVNQEAQSRRSELSLPPFVSLCGGELCRSHPRR